VNLVIPLIATKKLGKNDLLEIRAMLAAAGCGRARDPGNGLFQLQKSHLPVCHARTMKLSKRFTVLRRLPGSHAMPR